LSACMDAEEREEALRTARESGLEAIVDVGIDAADSEAAAGLAKASDLVFAACGVHPNTRNGDLEEVRRLLPQPRVVAVGETGLDGYRDSVPMDVQRERFEAHLDLAEEFGLPAMIHSRDAETECVGRAVARPKLKAVFHSFSGGASEAARIMAEGFFISFTGVVTFPSAGRLRETAKEAGVDQLLLETDSPFLAPQPERGKRNRPSYVEHSARVLADLLGYSVEDVVRATTVNARLLFNLGGLPTEPAVAYKIRNSLYLNITNRCGNDCTFCMRQWQDYHAGHFLKLKSEPSAAQVIAAIGDPTEYDEVVFCGFGEPTENLPVLIEVGKWLKLKGAAVRLDTNGQGDLINRIDVVKAISGIVDKVSVSLNAVDAETYVGLCRPRHGVAAYDSVVNFIRRAAKALPEVEVTAVEVPGVDVEACRRMAEETGAKFRKRKFRGRRRV